MQIFVCSCDEKCSWARYIHLSLSSQSQDSLRSVSGLSIVNVIHSQILENENEKVERQNDRVTVWQILVTHKLMLATNSKC